MKKTVLYALIIGMGLGMVSVSAQPRGSRSNDNNSGNNSSGPRRNFGNPQNSPQPQRNSSPRVDDRSFRNSNRQPGFSPQRNYNAQRNFTPPVNRNYQRSYGNRPGFYNNGFGRRPVVGVGFAGSYRNYHYFNRPRVVVSIGGPYHSIPFGGISYNYYNGFWYRPFGSSFSIVAPPIGIHIGTLPSGYRPVFGPWGDYYYYNNVFYRQPAGNQAYEVVDAPLGAQVPELPRDAEVRVIDGQKYYQLDGTFYREEVIDSQVWYTVVGKNGVVNTKGNFDEAPPVHELSVGDRISILPEGSKAITLNGQPFFAAPDGNYFQQLTEGGNTWYEVVGK